jgi:hypothetical protein
MTLRLPAIVSMTYGFALTRMLCRYTTKFSVRPPHENVDVNLTVAWWGNARGNAV